MSFLSRILVLCSPALWNSIDRSDDEEDGWRRKRKGTQWGNREDDNIDIDPCDSFPLKSLLSLLWKITAMLWKITPLFLRESIYNWGRGFFPLLVISLIKFAINPCNTYLKASGNFVLILLLESYCSHIFLHWFISSFFFFCLLFLFSSLPQRWQYEFIHRWCTIIEECLLHSFSKLYSPS